MYLRLRDRRADRELGALEANVGDVRRSAQEGERRGVVARGERCDLRDAGSARVGEQLGGEGRADAALLVVVGNLEGDLGALAVADETGDRDRLPVAFDVCNECMMCRVDQGQLPEFVF